MMNIIIWVILGALAGWIASMIMKRDSRMNWFANIVVGIIGAAIGGWVSTFIGFGPVTGFNLGSILIAIGGSCILLFIVGLFTRKV